MEGSRLVFVSVKNAKPRRKVAVPIPGGYSWEQFCQQVQTKLKLRGVGALHLASSGERVTTLEELQDIDELYVEEASPPPPVAVPQANGTSPDRAASGTYASSSGPPADGPSPKARNQQRQHVSPLETGSRDQASEPAQKYVKRSSGVRRSLQRVLPSLFAPSLPVTTRDAQEDGRKDGRSKRRRRRSSFLAPSNLLRLFGILVFVFVLFLLYSRMVPRLE